MMYYLAIDTGTTNSRIRLLLTSKDEIIDRIKIPIGVKSTAISGNKQQLKTELSKGVHDLLQRHNLSKECVEYIVAAGMITSNLGLYEIPHVRGPSKKEDFARASKLTYFDEFFGIPCILIPGMKNNVQHIDKNNSIIINDYDIMRGEEVETLGLLQNIHTSGKGLMVLPGSHTKYVFVDNDSLSHCMSTLGGEMLSALRKETILADSLDEGLVQIIDYEMLEQGFNATLETGLTRSLFHIRLLQMFSNVDSNARANYFVGAMIASDLHVLEKASDNFNDINWIVVGGSNPLRRSFTFLLRKRTPNIHVIEADDDQVELSTVLGAKKIAEICMRNQMQ
jgi:2-dehydro-3-deoxygalactonokinase